MQNAKKLTDASVLDVSSEAESLGAVLAAVGGDAIAARIDAADRLDDGLAEHGIVLDPVLAIVGLLPIKTAEVLVGKGLAISAAQYVGAVEERIIKPARTAYIIRRDRAHSASRITPEGLIEYGAFSAALAAGQAAVRTQVSRVAGDARIIATLAALPSYQRLALKRSAEALAGGATPARGWERLGPYLRDAAIKVARDVGSTDPAAIPDALHSLTLKDQERWRAAAERGDLAARESDSGADDGPRVDPRAAALLALAKRVRAAAKRAGAEHSAAVSGAARALEEVAAALMAAPASDAPETAPETKAKAKAKTKAKAKAKPAPVPDAAPETKPTKRARPVRAKSLVA